MPGEEARVFDRLERAFRRLNEALARPDDDTLALDASIQRFEFTIELFWKVMKRLLAREGVRTATPRETLERAFQAGWLNDEATWLEMLRARNETSHAYDEELALRIRAKVRAHLPELTRVLETLRGRCHQP